MVGSEDRFPDGDKFGGQFNGALHVARRPQEDADLVADIKYFRGSSVCCICARRPSYSITARLRSPAMPTELACISALLSVSE